MKVISNIEKVVPNAKHFLFYVELPSKCELQPRCPAQIQTRNNSGQSLSVATCDSSKKKCEVGNIILGSSLSGNYHKPVGIFSETMAMPIGKLSGKYLLHQEHLNPF